MHKGFLFNPEAKVQLSVVCKHPLACKLQLLPDALLVKYQREDLVSIMSEIVMAMTSSHARNVQLFLDVKNVADLSE